MGHSDPLHMEDRLPVGCRCPCRRLCIPVVPVLALVTLRYREEVLGLMTSPQLLTLTPTLTLTLTHSHRHPRRNPLQYHQCIEHQRRHIAEHQHQHQQGDSLFMAVGLRLSTRAVHYPLVLQRVWASPIIPVYHCPGPFLHRVNKGGLQRPPQHRLTAQSKLRPNLWRQDSRCLKGTSNTFTVC